MVTHVILRADNVDGSALDALLRWFEDTETQIPCSVFLTKTNDTWTTEQWDRLANQIESQGWEAGGNGRRGEILTQFAEEEIQRRVAANVRDIESNLPLDYSVRSFAYPDGDYDERVIAALQTLGIECGLTYPDGYPYESTITTPNGADRYRWGIAHHGYFDVDIWNRRFDYVHERGGLYTVCVHPQWWPTTDGSELETNTGIVTDVRPNQGHQEPDKLAAHISYLESLENVQFTTFRSLISE